MIKTILIPTDFSVKSLNLVKEALKNNQDTHTHIILLHGFYLSDSITEMLFFSKNRTMDKLQTPEFRASLRLLQTKYEPNLKRINVDLFSGMNQRAFDKYITVNEVDEIYQFEGYQLKSKHKQSFDVTRFFNTATVKKVKLKWNESVVHWSDQLAELFFKPPILPN